MSIRHLLSRAEIGRLTQSDHSYLKRKLREGCLLSELLNKPYNKRLLTELKCILDKKPLPRQHTGRFVMRQVSRISDGLRHPIHRRKMTDEELLRYGVKEVQLGQ